jgi:hypothetical protein
MNGNSGVGYSFALLSGQYMNVHAGSRQFITKADGMVHLGGYCRWKRCDQK